MDYSINTVLRARISRYESRHIETSVPKVEERGEAYRPGTFRLRFAIQKTGDEGPRVGGF